MAHEKYYTEYIRSNSDCSIDEKVIFNEAMTVEQFTLAVCESDNMVSVAIAIDGTDIFTDRLWYGILKPLKRKASDIPTEIKDKIVKRANKNGYANNNSYDLYI